MTKLLIDTQRFFLTLFYYIKEPDYKEILSELNEMERKLFNSMQRADKIHVHILFKQYRPQNIDKNLIYVQKRVIIFHDIGKRSEKLPLLRRVFRSIRYSIFKNNASYLNHALEGAKILSKEGFSEEIVSLVRHHHADCEEVSFLKKIEG